MLLIFLGLITIGAFICVIWYTETSKKRKQQQLILHREADIQLMNDQNNETSPNNDINDNSINYKADNSHTKNKTKVIIFVLLIVSVALIVTLLILEYSKTDFFTIYDKYCSSTWADVADDGSYLSIDTSPYDTGYFYDDAFKAIENVNKELGLPDSVIKNMESTRALDGRQTYTSGNITVSWSFHPNNGLEVLFESKRFKKKTPSYTHNFNSYSNKITNIDYDSSVALRNTIELALKNYDADVSAFDYDDDGALDIHITYHREQDNNFAYIFAYITDQTISILNSESNEYTEKIGSLSITCLGDARTMRWESNNLLSGKLMDLGTNVNSFHIAEDISLNELFKYCGYIPHKDTAVTTKKPSVSTKPSTTSPKITTDVTTEFATVEPEIKGAKVYSRPGTQYYQYGVIEFGTVVEILGYENDDWINLIFERKNAYIEAKYYSPLTATTGMIIDPSQGE